MCRRSAVWLALVLALALLAPATVYAAEPPPNDMFGSATVVSGLSFDTGVDTTAASLEPAEPNLCGGEKSVWYAFTAPTQLMLTVDAARSSFADVKLAAYRTSALTPVFCGSGRQATFSVPAGQTVYIQATDRGSGGGALRLTFAVYNNNFDGARSVDALPFASSVTANPATFEATAGERDPCGYGSTHTVWYVYAPVATTEVVVDTVGSDDSAPRLTVYFNKYGPGLAGLSTGICGTMTQIDFLAVAGNIYYIQAFGAGIQGTAIQLTIKEVLPDTTPPVITGTPADMTVATTNLAGAVVTYEQPVATDDVSGNVPVTCWPYPGATFPVGVTTVSCSASDAAGNTAVSSFSVTVTLDVSGDTTPPYFTFLPGDITMSVAGPGGAAIGYAQPTAYDELSGPAPVACEPASGSVFPVGTTHVTCTATDLAGNTATAGFDVTVTLLGPIVVAPIIPITSYDVDDAAMSGSGCWRHAYTGTVTDLGRTFDSGCSSPPSGGRLASYRGGGGTLNDGFDARTTDEDQLIFVNRPDDHGGVVDPVITLHLDGKYTISRIRVYGGQVEWNALPGQLIRATVVIGGESVTLDTVPFGPPNAIGVPTGDLLDLEGTALAGIATSTIVLRGFASGFIDEFPIAEITVDGTAVPADTTPPVPSITGITSPYAVDARIAISGSAADLVDPAPTVACSLAWPSGASARVDCAYSADAWSLGALGTYTFSVTATDATGNSASTSATFDVVATYASVENLTKAWSSKATVAKDLVAILETARAAEARGALTAEANKLAEYRAGVKAQSGKAFTAEKAALLIDSSRGL